jgi:hypothetical protein
VLPALMLLVVVAISLVFFLYARSLRQAQKEQTEVSDGGTKELTDNLRRFASALGTVGIPANWRKTPVPR